MRKDNYDKESCKEDSKDNNSYNENELEFESIKEGDYELNEKSNKHKDFQQNDILYNTKKKNIKKEKVFCIC